MARSMVRNTIVPPQMVKLIQTNVRNKLSTFRRMDTNEYRGAMATWFAPKD